jgi:hypothetical protein
MYCNQMFTVASYLVEKLSGQSFADYLRERFFEPLKMTSTHLQPDAAVAAGLKDRMATNYCWIEERKEIKPVSWEQCPESQGAGSIITSVNDHIKWVSALMNFEPPITEDICKELIRPRVVVNDNDDGLYPRTSFLTYALGLERSSYRGYNIVKHDGQISGSGSCHFFVPKLNFGAVVLANSSEASALGDILSFELMDEVLKVPIEDRPDWNAVMRESIDDYMQNEVKGDDLKRKMCPEFNGTNEQQKIPLASYAGQYWNAGYHGFNVEVKDGQLFVDAKDRGTGFSLLFEHVCGQTTYIAHLSSHLEEGDEPIEAEFRFDNDRVTKLGLRIESDLEEKIWFDRVT